MIEKASQGIKWGLIAMASTIVSAILGVIAMTLADIEFLATVFGYGWTVTKWGWYLVPFFPFDLLVASCAFAVVVGLFFSVPPLFYLLMRSNAKKENREANQLIAEYEKELQRANATTGSQ